MASRRPSVDLGKELTCSICTELLYQPLTLLDCLHTYCGACLKEWFRFQAAKVARAPTPPTPDTVIFTCPSCRSRVRDTKHNATVVTLLDMYIAANPARDRDDDDKLEMAAKYRPGDQVLPKIKVRERTAEERRADEEDRRLVDQVRQISLREAVAAGAAQASTRPRDRAESRSDGRHRGSGSSHHRRVESEGRHRRADNGGRERLPSDAHHATRQRNDSHPRQVEHQSSLRSLIGSQMSDREIEREIEDFARQIQEEGLLDGLDLDNIDLSRDDEFSRRITDAYRRRQRERQEPSRRSNASARGGGGGGGGGAPRPPEAGQESRLRPVSRPQSRSRAHSRSRSSAENAEERSRPPLSASANVDVRGGQEGRTRRRTTSGGRSSAAPLPSAADSAARPAARSQTDLTTLETESAVSTSAAPTVVVSGPARPGRSSSADAIPVPTQPAELPDAPNNRSNASFSNRLPQGASPVSGGPAHRPSAAPRPARPSRPSNLVLGNADDLMPDPLFSSADRRAQHRVAPQLYEEPSIACARCDKAHIEYDLHYHCRACNDGLWNICQECYRAGKGCLHWFGFGHSAWKKWDKRKQGDDGIAPPHTLTAARYVRPSSISTNAETGKAMAPEDPSTRLQTGAFCASCHEWANECYWRCHVCNEGEWGFCNGCVNQGRACSHKLLPLAHEHTQPCSAPDRPPRSPGRPPTASMMSGPQTAGMGPFKPLSFTTRCDLCQDAIPPAQPRLHCFTCTSTLIANASPGDYDICTRCYQDLESQGRVSEENGSSGWRRCLRGHRMVVVGFIDGKIGQWRYIERDLVGGIALRAEPAGSEHPDGLERWSWHHQGSEALERLVAPDVSESCADDSGRFPPDGGAGQRGHARWPWYPKAGSRGELLFPRGAEVQEIRDLNGDWFFGTYMGAKGVFPAPYVQLE